MQRERNLAARGCWEKGERKDGWRLLPSPSSCLSPRVCFYFSFLLSSLFRFLFDFLKESLRRRKSQHMVETRVYDVLSSATFLLPKELETPELKSKALIHYFGIRNIRFMKTCNGLCSKQTMPRAFTMFDAMPRTQALR